MKQIDNGVVMKRSKKYKMSEYLIKENGSSKMFFYLQKDFHILVFEGKLLLLL